MKNKIPPPLFLLLAALLSGQGCSLLTTDSGDDALPLTPEEQLPPLTVTGENTFGCLVNGEVWLPAGPDRYNRGFDVARHRHFYPG